MYLISYDLSNNRLRQKVAKEMENFGKRVQYSVFECDITAKQLETLYKRLAKIMASEPNGSVRIYSLCANCRKSTKIIGVYEAPKELTEEEEGLFIV